MYCTALVRLVDEPAEVAAGAATGSNPHLQRVQGQDGAQRRDICEPTSGRERWE